MYIFARTPNLSLPVCRCTCTRHMHTIAHDCSNGKDTCGASRVDDPVVSGGPDAYLSTLPSRLIQSRVQRAGVPCALSYSAGTFLCNCVMYTALHASKTLAENGHAENGDAPSMGFIAGFIHVPVREIAHARSHHCSSERRKTHVRARSHTCVENADILPLPIMHSSVAW